MCGIAGIYFGDGRPIDRGALQRMGDALAHRGPDAEGFHLDEEGPASVGLVNRRLAVIDVDGGDQPLTIANGAYTIVYNGELFNGNELRHELEAAGHTFRTRCDTEIVVRGYAEWGKAMLDRMLGMFAFAIWDRRAQRLFMARDHVGVKPLVYAQLAGGIVFGSEIKALTASGLVARSLDAHALPHFLSQFAVPEPYTLVKGVRRLPAGHALEADHHGVREFQYWDCAVSEEADRGADAYRDEFEELLDDAVRRQLVSDVPLGVLLSGGVDSRLIATFASRELPTLETFTLGFDDGPNEREAARAVASRLGADHHEAVMSGDDAARRLPDLLEAYDEPGQSLIQTDSIAGFTRNHVTVALSGLGGDELFAAYPTHVVVNLLARLDSLPALARETLHAAAATLPISGLRRAMELASLPPDERVSRELLHQTRASLRAELLAPELRGELDLDAPARHIEEHFDRARSHDPLNRLLYVYLKTYVPDELLRSADAMSMLHSLELRVPLLDHRLVTRALAVPAHHKMRFRTGKLLLRDIATRTLDEPLMTAKRGFAPPVSAWLRGPLAVQIRDMLAGPVVRRRGIFDAVAVERVLRRCLDGDERLVPAVMMLYSFETWAQRWLDRPCTQPAGAAVPVVQTPKATTPELSVVIVNWNTQELTRNSLASLERHLANVDHEVIVVDNASHDGSPEMIAAEFPHARLIRNTENVGFGVANNQGMRRALGSWLLLLNSDTELIDGSVARLLAHARGEPGLGVAHCRLQFPDGRLQHSAYRFPSVRLALFEGTGVYKLLPKRAGKILLGGYWDYAQERDVDWVAGAFMLLPREVFEQTGGFDERLFMYGEDLEWCYRIRDGGWRIRYYPDATVMHVDHASADIRWGDERIVLCLTRQRDIFAQRHSRVLATLLMAVGVIGATVRSVYYAVRIAARGPRSDAYRQMQRYQHLAVRTMLSLMLWRR